MKDQVREMIILDQDSEDEHSLIQHEMDNRKQNNNNLQGQKTNHPQNQVVQQFEDSQVDYGLEDGDEEGIVRNFHDEYDSEMEEGDEGQIMGGSGMNY